MFVYQLEETKQEEIRNRLVEVLSSEGLQGNELDEAIENGMNSKLNDLEEVLA